MADGDFDGGRHHRRHLPCRRRALLLAGFRARILRGPHRQPSRGSRSARKQSTGKKEVAEKETGAKPQGPLIIAISIDQQKVRVYDANGFFAESPVSTGMKGHPTPMGVFSIIQKHKLHHSNIYSGAPMPFMQRITWSGVAMHAGVLPGYPASHGCIRMPMAFAVKMWNWTKMGARVIVTPGEMSPANFSHPLLVAQKVVPQPVIADEPKADAPAVKSDKGADAGSAIKPADFAKQTWNCDRPSVMRSPLREQPAPRMPAAHAATNAAVTMSDAAPPQLPAKPLRRASKQSRKRRKSEPVKAEAEATAERRKPQSSDDQPPPTSSRLKPEIARTDDQDRSLRQRDREGEDKTPNRSSRRSRPKRQRDQVRRSEAGRSADRNAQGRCAQSRRTEGR